MKARLFLTLAPGQCRIPGCDRPSRTFGVCDEHEDEQVRLNFEHHVGLGGCKDKEPPCFDSHKQWREYVVSWVLAHAVARGGTVAKRRLQKVDPCRDCSPSFKARAMAVGACEHPETVFVRSSRMNDVVGVRIDWEKRAHASWESAMMGASGPVVALPPENVITETIERISSAPKPRGRPPKNRAE